MANEAASPRNLAGKGCAVMAKMSNEMVNIPQDREVGIWSKKRED